MRKSIILALLVIALGVCFVAPDVHAATDWSQFESGRSNIRLDGFQGQQGYIEFQDGSGTITGYLWMGFDGSVPVLRYCSAAAIDLTTTKLTDAVGVIVGTGY